MCGASGRQAGRYRGIRPKFRHASAVLKPLRSAQPSPSSATDQVNRLGPVFQEAGTMDSTASPEARGIEARLLDLREFPMPFFDQPLPPAMPGRPPYEHDVVKRWTAAIGASDGFIFVTPEYNYRASAVLKNAIDWVYPEWNRKAADFVSYGSAMGARSVQHLRETAIEIQMAPVRSSVHIPVATLWAHFQAPGNAILWRPHPRRFHRQ